MTIGEIISLISVLITFGSLCFVIKNNKRTDIKDIQEKAEKDANINYKLDVITNTVTDIKYDISATKKDVANLTLRVTDIESKLKVADYRMNNIEERANP